MNTTYNVRIWYIQKYVGAKVTTYTVRWSVAGKPWREPFRNKEQAKSFRSELLTAARKGEAFDVDSGRPVSMRRTERDVCWHELACQYVDLKWPRIAATTRRTHAEALTAITPRMFTTNRRKPDDKLIRKALCRWAFNTNQRDADDMPQEIRVALRWIEAHTKPVSAISDPSVLRSVLDGLTTKIDGTQRSPVVVTRWRKILNAVVEYAVEQKLLTTNPIPALKWQAPKTSQEVDQRSVPNPIQSRSLLNAVGDEAGGKHLVAFFGCLYFAALRPEEAVSLKKRNLSLPAEGWGKLHLEKAEPYAGREWTDSGEIRDDRQLKQRAIGETRTVPCPPELTALLHGHMEEFSTGPDGRLFVGERSGKQLSKMTIIRVWKRARAYVFTGEAADSMLAKTPYHLRHAAVSTWLAGGVPPKRVAEWAGHSIEVLYKIYAKCLDGEDELLRQRVDAALGHRRAG